MVQMNRLDLKSFLKMMSQAIDLRRLVVCFACIILIDGSCGVKIISSLCGGPRASPVTPISFFILARAACARCHITKCPILTAFFFSLSLSRSYFSPRRGYHRVPKFCMGFKVTKKKILGKTKCRAPLPPLPPGRSSF